MSWRCHCRPVTGEFIKPIGADIISEATIGSTSRIEGLGSWGRSEIAKRHADTRELFGTGTVDMGHLRGSPRLPAWAREHGHRERSTDPLAPRLVGADPVQRAPAMDDSAQAGVQRGRDRRGG